MAPSPMPIIAFKLVFGAAVAVFTSTGWAADDLPECNGLTDVFTGCDGFISALLAFVLTTIPGAHAMFNTILAVLTNGMLVWSIAAFGRGT